MGLTKKVAMDWGSAAGREGRAGLFFGEEVEVLGFFFGDGVGAVGLNVFVKLFHRAYRGPGRGAGRGAVRVEAAAVAFAVGGSSSSESERVMLSITSLRFPREVALGAIREEGESR